VGKSKPYGLNFMFTMEYIPRRRHFLRCIGRSTKTMLQAMDNLERKESVSKIMVDHSWDYEKLPSIHIRN